MNVRSGSQRRHPVLWATARLCAGVPQEEVYLLPLLCSPCGDPQSGHADKR